MRDYEDAEYDKLRKRLERKYKFASLKGAARDKIDKQIENEIWYDRKSYPKNV